MEARKPAEKLIEDRVNATIAEMKAHRKYEDIELQRTSIGEADQWIVDQEQETTGIDISGFSHEITNHFVIHAINNHGNPAAEKARGNIAITNADFLRIPQIVEKPDFICFGIKRRARGKIQDTIVYAKNFDDGTSLFFEAVLTGKKNKTLRGISFVKKKNTLSEKKFFNILETDKQNDLSKMKMVVGAGGQTGSEAT